MRYVASLMYFLNKTIKTINALRKSVKYVPIFLGKLEKKLAKNLMVGRNILQRWNKIHSRTFEKNRKKFFCDRILG